MSTPDRKNRRHRVSLWLNNAEIAQLQEICKDDQIGKSEFFRRALNQEYKFRQRLALFEDSKK